MDSKIKSIYLPTMQNVELTDEEREMLAETYCGMQWLLENVDAGMGAASDDFAEKVPYIFRLFSMRSTDHSRLVLLSNVNNVSDERKPGQNDGWKPENIKEGTLTRQQ